VFDPVLLYNIHGLQYRRLWLVEIILVFDPVLLFNIFGPQYNIVRLVEIILLYDPEAEFLDEIQTKVLRVFLLAIHSHLYSFALRFLTISRERGKLDRKPDPFPMV
jgi:hypothetical protein